jgi:hypothetical protein
MTNTITITAIDTNLRQAAIVIDGQLAKTVEYLAVDPEPGCISWYEARAFEYPDGERSEDPCLAYYGKETEEDMLGLIVDRCHGMCLEEEFEVIRK